MGIAPENQQEIKTEFARRRSRQYLLPLIGVPSIFVAMGVGLGVGMQVAHATGLPDAISFALMAVLCLGVLAGMRAFSRSDFKCPSCDRSLTAIRDGGGGSPYWGKDARCEHCGCTLS